MRRSARRQTVRARWQTAAAGLPPGSARLRGLARRFYRDLLGLAVDDSRPDLAFPGVWFRLGDRQLHLLEVPNPDPVSGRPAHGGRDRHTAVTVSDLDAFAARTAELPAAAAEAPAHSTVTSPSAFAAVTALAVASSDSAPSVTSARRRTAIRSPPLRL